MALLVQFSVGAACPGGNHIPITMVVTPGPDVLLTVQKPDAFAPLSVEERELFAWLLLRIYISQMPGNSTNAAIKLAVEAKILDLAVI